VYTPVNIMDFKIIFVGALFSIFIKYLYGAINPDANIDLSDLNYGNALEKVEVLNEKYNLILSEDAVPHHITIASSLRNGTSFIEFNYFHKELKRFALS
jgi:hypothetical protein